MNQLKQLSNGIIGSEIDYKKIQTKANAKILVISDSHGASNTLRHIILKYGESCDALIFAGDGVADLLVCLEEAYKEDYFMKCIPPVIALVKGNNDSDTFSSSFNPYDDNEIHEFYHIYAKRNLSVEIANRKIFISHGNEFGVYYSTESLENTAKATNSSIAIFGHTHCPTELIHQTYLLNPGSISCPRNLSKPSFAFLHITEKDNYSIFYKIDKLSPLTFEPYIPEVMYY